MQKMQKCGPGAAMKHPDPSMSRSLTSISWLIAILNIPVFPSEYPMYRFICIAWLYQLHIANEMVLCTRQEVGLIFLTKDKLFSYT